MPILTSSADPLTREEALASLRAKALFASALREDADIRSGMPGPTKTALQCQIERRGYTVEEWEEHRLAVSRGELAGGGNEQQSA